MALPIEPYVNSRSCQLSDMGFGRMRCSYCDVSPSQSYLIPSQRVKDFFYFHLCKNRTMTSRLNVSICQGNLWLSQWARLRSVNRASRLQPRLKIRCESDSKFVGERFAAGQPRPETVGFTDAHFASVIARTADRPRPQGAPSGGGRMTRTLRLVEPLQAFWRGPGRRVCRCRGCGTRASRQAGSVANSLGACRVEERNRDPRDARTSSGLGDSRLSWKFFGFSRPLYVISAP